MPDTTLARSLAFSFAVEARMPDPVDALILDRIEWIGPRARPYIEVIEAWRTSCPRLPVWEEANARGYIQLQHSDGAGVLVSVSPLGRTVLDARNERALLTGPKMTEI